MNNHSSENEEIRILDELICDAGANNPSVSGQGENFIVNFGENEGVHILQEQIWDASRQNEATSRFRQYPCEDYFASPYAERGCWDEPSQLFVIVPSQEITERADLEFLVVGRPGVDGIEFGYRRDQSGLWAYYPSEERFVFLAATVAELVQGWLSGKIKV